MLSEEIYARLQSLVGDAVSEFTPASKKEGGKDPGGPRDAFCKVTPARWHEVALALRDDEALRFDFLQSITGVDWPKQSPQPIVQVVYHLYSYALHHDFCVKADLPREDPSVPSVADVWGTADWNEREQFDLLGIGFTGHPDLRRIMLPDDWVGHPLRKDWKEPARYRGMPTTRPSPLELLPMFDKAPDDKKRLPLIVVTPPPGGVGQPSGDGHGDGGH